MTREDLMRERMALADLMADLEGEGRHLAAIPALMSSIARIDSVGSASAIVDALENAAAKYERRAHLSMLVGDAHSSSTDEAATLRSAANILRRTA